ncbi:MAG: hypothetical protein KGI26_05060 [Thaumarchaeota archaeon]|nr:hypothetical protein [Nitrososphaerota archaeon]
MPASSVGGLNAWGTYMLAALALLVVLSPALSSASRDAREASDLRYLEGVRAVLDSLRPGVAASFSFGVSAAGDPISAGGHTLASSYGSGAVEVHSEALLPNMTLRPATPYLASVSGGQIVVVQGG